MCGLRLEYLFHAQSIGREFDFPTSKSLKNARWHPSLELFECSIEDGASRFEIFAFGCKASAARERASKTGSERLCFSHAHMPHMSRAYVVNSHNSACQPAAGRKKDAGFLYDLRFTVKFITVPRNRENPMHFNDMTPENNAAFFARFPSEISASYGDSTPKSLTILISFDQFFELVFKFQMVNSAKINSAWEERFCWSKNWTSYRSENNIVGPSKQLYSTLKNN